MIHNNKGGDMFSWYRPLITFLVAALFTLTAHADPGITDNRILLGMSAPLSGPNGAYGTEIRESITAYFNAINKAGGVHGRKLELVVLDDGYETDRAVANTKKLINEDKVFALIGYYGSTPTTAAMEVFSAEKVPLVGSISGAESLRRPVNRYMFNVRASYARETEAIINALAPLSLRNIAVFYQNDGFGKSGLEGITQAMKHHNLSPSAVATVERNSLNVGAAVKTIAKANPQAVIMVTLYKPTAEFVRQLHKAGQYPQLMTLSPVGADLLVKELGEEARGIGISQVMPYPWNDGNPLAREFRKTMTAAGKTAHSAYYGEEGYAMAKVLVDGLKNAGREVSRDKLVGSLEAMKNHDLGGYKITYSPTDHNGSEFVDLTVIGNGGRVLH